MNIQRLLSQLLLLLCLTPVIAEENNLAHSIENEPFMIKNGDRVVFWGDSITVAGIYVKNIENYIRNRYPHYQIHLLTQGWSGGKTRNWQQLVRDVLPFKPTVVFIMLGMNDGAYKAFQPETLAQYLAGMEKLVKILEEKTSARIVLITTIPYEAGVKDDLRGKMLSQVYVDTLRQLSKGLIQFANKHYYPVIDLNQAYLAHINRYKQAQPALQFSTDGIHPNPTGHALMAFLLLREMKADGNIMSLTVDINKGTVITADNQIITQVTGTDDELNLMRQPLAFPFKVSGEESLKIAVQPWYDQLNRNMIKVIGLTKPFCLLSVNGIPVEVFSQAEIAKGVNIARIGLMPEDKVTKFVDQLVADKFAARVQRWRGGITSGIAYNKYLPLKPDNFETRYLHLKGELIANYLNSDQITLKPYQLSFQALDEYNRYPNAPFKVIPPYPNEEQVQILFVVDTTPWQNIISKRSTQPLSFQPPLKIKGQFTKWQPVTMYDNGNHGDEIANDGKWSIVINLKRENRVRIFAFDDSHPLRAAHESVIMEIIKTGLGKVPAIGRNKHPFVIPHSHQKIEITAAHFSQAVALGYILMMNDEW